MIKVYYSGYGRILHIKSSCLFKKVHNFGSDCYLLPDDVWRFKKIGKTTVRELVSDEYKQFTLVLTNEKGEPCPFEICKGQNLYTQENGNALELQLGSEPQQDNSKNQTNPTTDDLGEQSKLQKQQLAILAVIKQLEFDPMAVPDGKKSKIESVCVANYPLLFDSESGFNTAWKKGRNLFKMAHHARYAKRSMK